MNFEIYDFYVFKVIEYPHVLEKITDFKMPNMLSI
jgi:hypothetical protein